MDEYGFESRLRHLEHILVGQNNNKATQENIMKRIQTVLKELDSVYKNNKAIKDFITKYDAHAKVLNPNTSTYSLEREILAPEVKLELILAAQEDLEKFAQEISQVKDLEHVVNGAEFDAVEKLGPELLPLEVVHSNQVSELNQVTKQISDFMERYNGTVNTISEIFISWDSILTNIETHVSALEHQTLK